MAERIPPILDDAMKSKHWDIMKATQRVGVANLGNLQPAGQCLETLSYYSCILVLVTFICILTVIKIKFDYM